MDFGDSSLNSSSLKNNTFDMFCTDLSVGPVAWAIFSVLCALVGLPASMRLLWVFIHQQHSGLSSSIYMLNLTIMDLVFNLCIIPSVLNFFVWHDKIIFSVNTVLYAFGLCGRPLFTVCICADCYMAVVHPITYMKMKNSRYRLVICALVLIFTLASGRFDKQYFTVSIGFSAPVVAFCDIAILCTLRKPDPSGRSDVHPQKQRAMQAITNSLVMTVVSYPPLLVVNGIYALNVLTPQQFYCHVLMPSLIASTTGSTITPLLSLWDLRLLGCNRKQ